jgi:hypothetical protein
MHCLVRLSLQPVVENLTVLVFGGTVKKLVARTSLQRPLDNQILPVEKMFEYCKSNIKGVNLINMTNVDIAPACQANVVYQIQKWKNNSWYNEFSSFSPLSEGDVTYVRVSDDEVASGTFKFFDTKIYT